MAKPKKTIFIDTQIFLHYTFFIDVDWTVVADASEVTIVMPPIVMRELEKHKYNQKDEALKRRAETASARLAQLFKLGKEVRPRTQIVFEGREPDEEFATYRLSRETQDDHLLASICLYKREHPDEDILLITNDLPLQVKASPLLIETLELSAEHRLPVEADPNLKKVRELERQLRELTLRVPRPGLQFDNGQSHLEFKAPTRPSEIWSVDRRMEEIRRKYQKMDVPPLPAQPPQPERTDTYEVVIPVSLYPDDKPHPRAIEKYNQELDSFYEEYEQYLVERDRAEELNARKLELKIQLGNSGTAPVENAVVFMKIPGYLRITRNEEMFNYPRAPKPPDPPKPRSHSSYGNSYEPPCAPIIAPPYRPNTYIEPPNVERNDFSHDENYYRVSFRVRQATHNLVYDCPYEMYVIFDSLDKARSFKIEYNIIAANIPKPVDGALHVVVRREGVKEDAG